MPAHIAESVNSSASTTRSALGFGADAANSNWTELTGQPWRHLAQAQQSGDRMGLAMASMALAHRSVEEGDLDEARWHLQRGRMVLESHRCCTASISLQCELAGMALTIAQRWHTQGEPVTSRRLDDEVRDACFEVARNCAGLDDVAVRVSALLRVAELLESLGDASDAQGMRMQAFNGLGHGAVVAN